MIKLTNCPLIRNYFKLQQKDMVFLVDNAIVVVSFQERKIAEGYDDENLKWQHLQIDRQILLLESQISNLQREMRDEQIFRTNNYNPAQWEFIGKFQEKQAEYNEELRRIREYNEPYKLKIQDLGVEIRRLRNSQKDYHVPPKYSRFPYIKSCYDVITKDITETPSNFDISCINSCGEESKCGRVEWFFMEHSQQDVESFNMELKHQVKSKVQVHESAKCGFQIVHGTLEQIL